MKYQWMAALVVLAVVPLIILISVTVTTSHSGMSAKLPQVMQNHLANLGSSLDLVMAGTENLMMAMAGSANFRNDLNELANLPTTSEFESARQSLKQSIAGWLGTQQKKSSFIKRIMVLGGPETSVNCNFDSDTAYQKATGSEWYHSIPAAAGKFLWIGSHPGLDAPGHTQTGYALSCLMRLNGSFILIADVADIPVSHLLSRSLIPGGGGTYLVDPAGRVVAESQSGTRDSTARLAILYQALKPEKVSKEFSRNKHRVRFESLAEDPSTKIGYYPLSRSGWGLIAIITGAEYQNVTGELFWILLLSGLILAACLIGAGFLVTNRISGRLNQVIKAFRQADSGNINHSLTIRSRDEIGAAAAGYHAMTKNFTPFVASIRQLSERQNNVADNMITAFKEIAENVSNVLNNIREAAGSAAEQSDDTSGLSRFINEMAEKVDSITVNIKSIQEIGINTQNLTTTGIESIENLNRNVKNTNSITVSISDHLTALNEETVKISEMVSSIHEIADRNNILALNSLINAAKAGESGRGFSVVANNVKKLAERSMIVTREISDFINNLQKRMIATAEAAAGIGVTVEAQNQAFNDSIRIFNRINAVTNHLTERLIEIIQLVENMEANKTDTLNSMNSISFRSAQISAMMKEILNSLESQLNAISSIIKLAKELKKISRHLQKTIKDFKIA